MNLPTMIGFWNCPGGGPALLLIGTVGLEAYFLDGHSCKVDEDDLGVVMSSVGWFMWCDVHNHHIRI